MTERTLEGAAPRLTLEELEGRTQFRTPGLWRVAPTSDYPPGAKPGINIDAGKHGTDGFVCEVCGPNPDEQMRADAYFIAHAPDLLAIAQGQRARLAALDSAPRWSRHSERCGVAAALGVTTDRSDLDSVVYAVVKKLMDMRGGAAILSIELQEWMRKWPHQAASRR